MKEIFAFMLNSYRQLLDMLIEKGQFVGMAIVCWPVFTWLVRAVRSIIKK